MTAPTDASGPGRELRDWEAPGQLLRRYLEAAGAQVLGGVLCVAGFIAVAVGWWKISSEAVVALQIPYLVSGGIGGVLLLGMGGVLLVSHDLRLDNRRLEALEAMVAELRDALLVEVEDQAAATLRLPTASARPATASGGGPSNGDATLSGYVRVQGGNRFHLPDCPIAAEKPVDFVDASVLPTLQACKVCSPVLAQ